MRGWVTLTGPLSRPQIRGCFARADLFVAPATLESFGIAALEARCAGLPVVARSQSGIGDFLVDGRDGRLVDSDAAMVRTLTELASDPTQRAAIAARSRFSPPPVTWEDVMGRTFEAYSAAAQLAGRPAPRLQEASD
jgi:glycosyltransferase involved in cell wall biosynthesis